MRKTATTIALVLLATSWLTTAGWAAGGCDDYVDLVPQEAAEASTVLPTDYRVCIDGTGGETAPLWTDGVTTLGEFYADRGDVEAVRVLVTTEAPAVDASIIPTCAPERDSSALDVLVTGGHQEAAYALLVDGVQVAEFFGPSAGSWPGPLEGSATIIDTDTGETVAGGSFALDCPADASTSAPEAGDGTLESVGIAETGPREVGAVLVAALLALVLGALTLRSKKVDA